MSAAPSSVPVLFDQRRLRLARDRAARADPSHRFLADLCMDRLEERLAMVRRPFETILQLGALTSRSLAAPDASIVRCDIAHAPLRGAPGAAVQAAPDMLPFASETFDLAVSPFALHTVNDLPGALTQIRRVLKPDGLFLAAMAGGETLWQMRQCLMETELRLFGGASPRVYPFAGKPEMGALLQRAGYALPVVDSELVTVTYGGMPDLMRDIRLMGESNMAANGDKRHAGRRFFAEASALYAERFGTGDGRVEATFDIVFLLGWSPHASQQRPLRPGQATARLADALDAAEIGTGVAAGP